MIMNEAKISAEKRKSPRVKTSIPIRYRVQRDGTEAVGAGSVTCDVSTGGLRFMANEFFSTACRLILELDIPTMEKPIKAVSKVAWIEKAKPGADYEYEVGNQFMEINAKDKELIAKYVRSI
jgi:hypothetical protein